MESLPGRAKWRVGVSWSVPSLTRDEKMNLAQTFTGGLHGVTGLRL